MAPLDLHFQITLLNVPFNVRTDWSDLPVIFKIHEVPRKKQKLFSGKLSLDHFRENSKIILSFTWEIYVIKSIR